MIACVLMSLAAEENTKCNSTIYRAGGGVTHLEGDWCVRLVGMVGDEQRLLAGSSLEITLEFAQTGHTVGLGELQKLGLTSLDVLGHALPGGDCGGLKSASKAEGESPRLFARQLVDRIKVARGVQLRLATRQEHDA